MMEVDGVQVSKAVMTCWDLQASPPPRGIPVSLLAVDPDFFGPLRWCVPG